MTNEFDHDEVAARLERHALDHRGADYEITFPEGDAYLCRWDNGEYVDNGEDLESPAYEEWYELDYKVLEVMKEGPNKDPRFEYVNVSCKRLPSLVTCDGEIVYRAE